MVRVWHTALLPLIHATAGHLTVHPWQPHEDGPAYHPVVATLSLGAGVLTDVVIAAPLAFFLRRLRTGHRRADSLVTQLTVYAVNTGAITAAVAICTLVFVSLAMFLRVSPR